MALDGTTRQFVPARILHFHRPEANVIKRNLICATATVILGVSAAACSSARGDERAGGDGATGSGDSVTISGCLTAGPDGNFALTAAPDAAVATAARAMNDERETHTYVLLGGDNLTQHLGKRVEVVGTIEGKKQEMEQNSKKTTEGTPDSRDGDTPTVKTKEEIDLEVRQLRVNTVRDVAPTCVVNP
jgi:hypothetical protein